MFKKPQKIPTVKIIKPTRDKYDPLTKLHEVIRRRLETDWGYDRVRLTHEINILNQYYEKLPLLRKGKPIEIVYASPDNTLLNNFKLIPIKIGKKYTIVKSYVKVHGGYNTRVFYIPNSKVHGTRIMLADARYPKNQLNRMIPFNVGHADIRNAVWKETTIYELQGGFSSEIDREKHNLISRGLTTEHSLWRRKLLSAIIIDAVKRGNKVLIPTGAVYSKNIQRQNKSPYDLIAHDKLVKEVAVELGLEISSDDKKHVIKPKLSPVKKMTKGIWERLFGGE